MIQRALLMLACSVLISFNAAAANFPKLRVVPVDPLVNVFRDSNVRADESAMADSARGEHATHQLVVTSGPVELQDLRCEVTTFTLAGGEAALPQARVRFVGYIGSSVSAGKPAKDQLRPAPAMYPDPLLENRTINVSERDNQPVWITVRVPEKAMPGDYMATATVSARIFGYETSATVPLTIKVHAATITSTRLNVTNWYQMWHHANQPMPERFSPEYFDVLRQYVRSMVAHRQNWGRVETLWIMGFTRDEEGNLGFDFTNFDKWMNILFQEGIQKVEGLQFAWRSGKWEAPYHVEVHDENDKDYKGRRVPADSVEAQQFYSAFVPALHAHLKEKGWLDRYVQHVGDEPVAQNADSYTTASMLFRKHAPGVPIMEACLARNMVGAIDIWVPTLEHLHQNEAFFNERRAAGNKVWFYTCVQPQGEYANRYVELPLIKTRLLHWINYRYDVDGFLHWGYNFWRPHPWDNAADPKAKLPGGDAWIVYPQKDGLGVVDSIRFEAMRDGIEDHELLSQLGERNPEAAMELAKRHVLEYDKYNTDVTEFRKTRRELLEALSK